MDGAIIAVLRVETEKAQLRLARSGTGVEEDGRNVELALKLSLDGADPEVWVKCLQIGHQDDRIRLAFQTGQQRLQTFLELSLGGQRVRERTVGPVPLQRGLTVAGKPDIAEGSLL